MKGVEIKAILKRDGYSQKQIAEMIGESPQNFSAMLVSDDVKSGTIEKIAHAIGVPVAYFYGIQPSAVNTGTNNGNIAGRDINTSEQINSLHGIIGSQQQTIAELSATIAKLVK